MTPLGGAGLVRSVRGAGGGYQFAGNARRTTLLDVMQLFEELGSGGSSGRAIGKMTDVERAMLGVFREIDDMARATLGSITIATMLKLVDRAALARR